jgi:hypothetical protein
VADKDELKIRNTTVPDLEPSDGFAAATFFDKDGNEIPPPIEVRSPVGVGKSPWLTTRPRPATETPEPWRKRLSSLEGRTDGRL